MNIQEIRAQYPQYNDLSDTQLADALHGKYYSDMSRAEFYTKIGIASKAEPTAMDRVNAATSGVVRGVAGLAGLPVDTMQGAANLLAAGGHAAASLVTDAGVFQPPFQGGPLSSHGIAQTLNNAGLITDNPRPDDAASRMLHTGGLVASTAGRRPVAPAVAGSVAAEVTGDPKFAAVGAAVPQASSQVVTAARQAVANRVQPNVREFQEAGTQPTVGQATESNFMQGVESLLSKFPGGQGVFRRVAEQQQKDINPRTGVSGEDAGRAIERGIKGPGGFLERTKDTWKQLDDAVAQKVGNATAPTTNTAKALDDLTKPSAGVDAFVNPTISKIKDQLAGNPSFQELRELRGRVGSMIDDSLVSGVPQGELKKLYGAISKDLESSANNAGAGKDFARQSEYYSARMDRVENVLERVLGKTPEETFQKFFPKDPNQATTVRAVMRSLDPAQRQVVQQAVVDRLGRAKSGKQDETGEVFSSETFLTNWNNLSPGAKGQIFSDPAVRRNMDAIAGASSNIREGSKVFANPSGSAEKGAALAVAGAVGTSIMTGNPAPAMVAGGMVAGANVGARMLTSPKVVEWLAQAPRVSQENAAGHLARLAVIFNESKDERLKQELGEYINSVK